MATKTGFSRKSVSFSVIRTHEPVGQEFEDAILSKSYVQVSPTLDNEVVDFCRGNHLMNLDEAPVNLRYGGCIYFSIRKREKTIDSNTQHEMEAKMLEKEYQETGKEPSGKRAKQIKEAARMALEPLAREKVTGIRVAASVGSNYIFVAGGPKVAEKVIGHLELATDRNDFVVVDPVSLLSMSNEKAEEDYESFKMCGHDSPTTVGQDFLTWMWMASETERALAGGISIGIGESVSFAEPGDGNGGSKLVKLSKGNPNESREAFAAFQEGKKLSEAKFTLSESDGNGYEFTTSASMGFKSFKICDENVKGRATEDVFFDRVIAMGVFIKTISTLFDAFLRFSDHNQSLIDKWLVNKWNWEKPKERHVYQPPKEETVEEEATEEATGEATEEESDNPNCFRGEVDVYLENKKLGTVKNVLIGGGTSDHSIAMYCYHNSPEIASTIDKYKTKTHVIAKWNPDRQKRYAIELSFKTEEDRQIALEIDANLLS